MRIGQRSPAGSFSVMKVFSVASVLSVFSVFPLYSGAGVENPLLPKWHGPLGGVPPFDQVKVEHFKPALEAAMAEQLAEIEKIAADPAPPTFSNTIAAMASSG